MLPRSLVLSALVMLSLSACSGLPSVSLTVKQTPPQSCLQSCDPLEEPMDGSELSVRRWEYRAVEQYGQCRRLHDDCKDWVSK